MRVHSLAIRRNGARRGFVGMSVVWLLAVGAGCPAPSPPPSAPSPTATPSQPPAPAPCHTAPRRVGGPPPAAPRPLRDTSRSVVEAQHWRHARPVHECASARRG